MKRAGDIRDLLAMAKQLMDVPPFRQGYTCEPLNSWTTAVTSRLEKSDSTNEFRANPEGSDETLPHPFEVIYHRLGHQKINVSDDYTSRMLVNSYVYRYENGAGGRCTNASESNSRKLAEHAIKIARRMRTPELVQRRETHVLHATRGVGKTFFLNHHFSKYGPDFDANKIIWVRLNLVNFPAVTFSLQHRIYAQIAKIVFRFYDPHSDAPGKRALPRELQLDLTEELVERMKSRCQSRLARRKVEGLVLATNQLFYRKWYNTSLNDHPIDFTVASGLTELVLEKGFGFIIALDGLDRLDTTSQIKNRFRALVDQLTSILSQEEGIPGALMLVSRSRTYQNVLKDRIAKGPGEPHSPKERYLESTGLISIFQKRIECIQRELSERESKGELSESAGWREYLGDFQEYARKHPYYGVDAVNEIDQLYSENNRAKVFALQLLWEQYLKERGTGIPAIKSYRLTESLMLQGKVYPEPAYIYDRKPDGTVERHIVDKTHDLPLLPSLFSFPSQPHESQSQVTDTFPMLMGLRILQLVQCYDKTRLKHRKRNKHKLTGEELARICGHLFDYDKFSVLALIEDFGEFELFYLDGPGFPMFDSAADQLLELRPRGNRLLDHLIQECSYLNLCAMILPISETWLNPADYPMILARSLNVEGFEEWIAAKVINSLTMYRLVAFHNKIEEAKFRARLDGLSTDQSFRYTLMTEGDALLFSFVEDMKESILGQLGAIFHSITPEALDFLRGILHQYEKLELDRNLLDQNQYAAKRGNLSVAPIVRFPKRCRRGQKHLLEVGLLVESVAEEASHGSDTRTAHKFVTRPVHVVVTAPGFGWDHRPKTIFLPLQGTSSVVFEMTPLAGGPQIIEIELFLRTRRIAYLTVESEVGEA